MVEGIIIIAFFFVGIGFYAGIEKGDFLIIFITIMVIGGAYGLSLLVSLSKESGDSLFLRRVFY